MFIATGPHISVDWKTKQQINLFIQYDSTGWKIYSIH